jgi:hypothetical protein
MLPPSSSLAVLAPKQRRCSPTPLSPIFFGRGKPNNALTYQESATRKQSVGRNRRTGLSQPDARQHTRTARKPSQAPAEFQRTATCSCCPRRCRTPSPSHPTKRPPGSAARSPLGPSKLDGTCRARAAAAKMKEAGDIGLAELMCALDLYESHGVLWANTVPMVG